jgi:DNA-binding LacI/PurR family transcriptional regulator
MPPAESWQSAASSTAVTDESRSSAVPRQYNRSDRESPVRAQLDLRATLTTTEYDTRAGLAVAEDLIGYRAEQRPTGLFAINDSIAIGLQRGFQSAGLSVPGDVAVVG